MTNNEVQQQRARKELARLRSDLMRLRVKQNVLQNRLNGAAAIEGARSGNLGKQRRTGTQPSIQALRQEQEVIARQLANTEQQLERLEGQLAPTPAEPEIAQEKTSAAE